MTATVPPTTSQLDLGFGRVPEPDRNFAKGGRSFYFFDLDDNVFFLSTPIYIFHQETGEEVALSTRDFAIHNKNIGKQGKFARYKVWLDQDRGSFRRFRDFPGANQPFYDDIREAIRQPDFTWKGPSWTFFHHAVFNQRPMALITARGHGPDTLKGGIELLRAEGHLTHTPNYMSVFPVSNPEIRKELGDHVGDWSTAKLKQAAIIQSVEAAMRIYGDNPHHRFGMSDDDPHNIELILEAMKELKRRYEQNSFFVFTSHSDPIIRQEVFVDRVERQIGHPSQLTLFE
ncbi:MAG: hypothetical protein AB7P04_09070 [Bacteriovoracia bacterium]